MWDRQNSKASGLFPMPYLLVIESSERQFNP